jgi:hypothetical protein
MCSYLCDSTCVQDINFMCLPIAVESLKTQSYVHNSLYFAEQFRSDSSK